MNFLTSPLLLAHVTCDVSILTTVSPCQNQELPRCLLINDTQSPQKNLSAMTTSHGVSMFHMSLHRTRLCDRNSDSFLRSTLLLIGLVAVVDIPPPDTG